MAGRDSAVAMSREPHVLVVAGSDSSGGAGIARDAETIATLGLRPCLALTAVTVQTYASAGRIETMRPDLVAAQMRAALGANPVRASKIGMLGTSEAGNCDDPQGPRQHPSRSRPGARVIGRALLTEDAVAALRRSLIPLCCLVTPNLIELAPLPDRRRP